jgi:hypothetical protein
MVTESGETTIAIEHERVKRVALKLGRGHAAYELAEPIRNEPTLVRITPIHMLSFDARDHFESPPTPAVWPELGSRAMQRMVVSDEAVFGPDWIQVQSGQYRYLAITGGPVMIRLVVGEYLACEVIWESRGAVWTAP